MSLRFPEVVPELTAGPARLRGAVPADAPDLFTLMSDSRISRWMSLHAETRAQVEAWIEEMATLFRDRRAIYWIVEHQERVVGRVHLFEVDHDARSAQIDFCLSPDLWGRGLTTLAASAVSAWGFRHCGLNRVWATASAGNPASRRVLSKLGYEREAILTGHALVDGKPADVHVYARLRSDASPPAAE